MLRPRPPRRRRPPQHTCAPEDGRPAHPRGLVRAACCEAASWQPPAVASRCSLPLGCPTGCPLRALQAAPAPPRDQDAVARQVGWLAVGQGWAAARGQGRVESVVHGTGGAPTASRPNPALRRRPGLRTHGPRGRTAPLPTCGAGTASAAQRASTPTATCSQTPSPRPPTLRAPSRWRPWTVTPSPRRRVRAAGLEPGLKAEAPPRLRAPPPARLRPGLRRPVGGARGEPCPRCPCCRRCGAGGVGGARHAAGAAGGGHLPHGPCF